MNKLMRRSLKALAGIVIVIAVLLAMQISVVAFPHPWFDQSARDGRLTIYSDDVAGPELEAVLRGVRERLQAAEIYDDSVDLRVFVCNSQRLYNLFARLSRVPTHVPGFNLSLFNNSFVSVPLLEQRQRTNRAGVKHSVLAGDLDAAIAHELIHDLTQETIGFFPYRRLPRWKSEGYAEYAANRARLQRDTGLPLADRITLMKTGLSDPRARAYYRWNLVVEYLAEEQGYSLAEIIDPAVTLDDATMEMMAWYNRRP